MKANVSSTVAPAAYTFSDLYIGGAWRSGHTGERLDVRDPYTDRSVASISKADMRDVELAFRAAEASQPGWAEALPMQRADVFRRVAVVMEQRHEEIVGWLIHESGSTRTKAEIEWGAVHASMLEASTLPTRLEGQILAGDYPGKENRIYRRPVGVVTVISPWNWPLHLSVRSVVPALALGNAVVLKPAVETPVTGGLLLARLFEEAGLPPGVLNVLVGDTGTIGDGIVQHPVARVISFTGSTRVGRHIGQLAATASTLKKAMLELGGTLRWWCWTTSTSTMRCIWRAWPSSCTRARCASRPTASSWSPPSTRRSWIGSWPTRSRSRSATRTTRTR